MSDALLWHRGSTVLSLASQWCTCWLPLPVLCCHVLQLILFLTSLRQVLRREVQYGAHSTPEEVRLLALFFFFLGSSGLFPFGRKDAVLSAHESACVQCGRGTGRVACLLWYSLRKCTVCIVVTEWFLVLLCCCAAVLRYARS